MKKVDRQAINDITHTHLSAAKTMKPQSTTVTYGYIVCQYKKPFMVELCLEASMFKLPFTKLCASTLISL